MALFSVRGLPDDILLVEKGPNGGVGFSHLRVGKSAMLAARDCHELVAYSRIVECLMEADILRVRNSWICVSLDRNNGRQSSSNIRQRGHPFCNLLAIRHAAKPRDREIPHVGASEQLVDILELAAFEKRLGEIPQVASADASAAVLSEIGGTAISEVELRRFRLALPLGLPLCGGLVLSLAFALVAASARPKVSA